MSEINLYPDGGCYDLTTKISEFRGVKENKSLLETALTNFRYDCTSFLGENTEAIMGNHSFAVYKLATLAMNAKPVEIDMPAPDYKHNLKAMKEAINERTRLVFLANQTILLVLK